MEYTASLVRKVRNGDRAAFNELYRMHYLSLLSYAELLLDADEAKDVVQDVFLNAWIHRENLDETLSVRSYLLRSVYNSALNILKKKGYSSEYISSFESEIKQMGSVLYDPDSNDIIHRLYNQELKINIDAAIDSLPTRCKEVFTLSYLDDLPSKEISSKLGISLSTVENHIYSALKQLREKLRHYRFKESGK
ncbi:MAG: RNA polymerase sigma-70 factor [Tannerellaceae bacterium]|nr:RNA polymerase sigma-70 factor [Tannerellaceae bacterium]